MTAARARLLRLAVAAVVGAAAPYVEVAARCRGEPRPGRATSEACTWARAYLPLTRPAYFVLVGGLTWLLLGIASGARRGAGAPPRRAPPR